MKRSKREEHNDFCKRKGHLDKDGEVQYLAILKRTKRAAEFEEQLD